jgi:hypothetical protein
MALPSASTSWLVDLTGVLSDVRFWHFSDLAGRTSDFRFWGHNRNLVEAVRVSVARRDNRKNCKRHASKTDKCKKDTGEEVATAADLPKFKYRVCGVLRVISHRHS